MRTLVPDCWPGEGDCSRVAVPLDTGRVHVAHAPLSLGLFTVLYRAAATVVPRLRVEPFPCGGSGSQCISQWSDPLLRHGRSQPWAARIPRSAGPERVGASDLAVLLLTRLLVHVAERE